MYELIPTAVAGSFMVGFKALALMAGKETMWGELRSLVTFVVLVQVVANLQAFPYLAELILVPMAVLLAGMQAVATHGDEHKAARSLITGTIIVLGWCVLAWSVYKLATSLGSNEWGAVGKSVALAFWLPVALLPAIYIAALVMQYGSTISMMNVVRSPSLGARMDFYLHHRLSLRRLTAFAHTPGRARYYARASNRDERMAILRASGRNSLETSDT